MAAESGRRKIDKEREKVSIRPEKERLAVFCADCYKIYSAFQTCLQKQTMNIFQTK